MRRKATPDRGNYAKRRDYEQHRIEAKRSRDIAVEQVVQGACRAAAGALQAGQFVKGAAREKVYGRRVEAIEDRCSADRKNPGDDANEGC